MNYDLIAIIISLVALLVAYFQARKANKLQKEIAVLDGVYKKDNLEIEVFSKKQFTSMALGFTKSGGDFGILEVPITITNTGDKISNDLEVYICIPKILGSISKETISFSNKGLKEATIRHLDTTKHLNLFGFTIPNLKAKQKMLISLPFLLKNSSLLETNVTTVTKDDVLVNATLEIVYSAVVKVEVIGETQAVSKIFSVLLVDYTNSTFKEEINNVNSRYKVDERRETKGKSVIRKIKAVMYSIRNPQKLERALFIEPTLPISKTGQIISEVSLSNGFYCDEIGFIYFGK